MKIEVYKKAIIVFLESRDNFADIDEFLIDELVFNMNMLMKAREDLEMKGLTETGRFGSKLTAEFIAYQMLQKEVKAAWSILGISPKDRMKLRLEVAEKEDEFDEIFN
mgnify:CR=1 FL=1